MSHSETYKIKFEQDRLVGNNYDIVTYKENEYCLECGTLISSDMITERAPIKNSLLSGDE